MQGLKDNRFKLVWASSFMMVKAFEQLFYAIGETCISDFLECRLGLKKGFLPGSCWDGRGRGFAIIL